ALRAATGVPRTGRERAAHDLILTTLRSRLPREDFARAWTEGQTLTLEQVTATALAIQAQEDHPGPGAFVAAQPSPETASFTTAGFDLTPREIEVLRHLTHGLTYAQIAETLVISPRTVDAHVRAIFGKLAVRTRTAATRIALEHRLV